MRLSTRLALTLALLLAVSFSVFGSVQWIGLRKVLLRQVDRNLAVRAASLARDLEEVGSIEALASPHLNPDPLLESSSPEVFVEVRSPEGRTLAASDNLRRHRLPDPDPASRGRPATVHLPGESPLRVLEVAAFRDGQLVARVVVAEPLGLALGWLAGAATLTAAVGLVTLALAVLASVAVVRRGLQPLKDVACTAQTIVRTGDVSRRVPTSGTSDVVGQVSESLNALLARVEHLLETERRLLADTSHELRNPLTVLRTDLDLLKRDLDAATRIEVAEEAEAETGRMIRLVDQLLLLSWTESVGVAHEPIRLDELVRASLERHRPLAEEQGLALEVGDLPPAMVVGEADRLTQVLANLLGNALNYTPEGGRIQVRLLPLEEGWRLEVEDSGIGISEEHLERLFDRFYRVDPARGRNSGGTGLGLAVTRSLVQAHGGRIGVRSRLGEGSCFHVELPAAPL